MLVGVDEGCIQVVQELFPRERILVDPEQECMQAVPEQECIQAVPEQEYNLSGQEPLECRQEHPAEAVEVHSERS